MSSLKSYRVPSSSESKPFVDVSPAMGAEQPGSVAGTLYSAVAATAVLTVVCCAVYPLAVWGVAQAIFPQQANGSLVTRDGKPTTDASQAVGSTLIGQNFSGTGYFHPRPSSAGAGYDAGASSGSNLGPLSDKLLNGVVAKDDKGTESVSFDGIRLRTLKYAIENGITFTSSMPMAQFHKADGSLDEVKVVNTKELVFSGFSQPIPADAVTASGSGLDPHISPANAKIQVARVAKARGMSEGDVAKLVEQYTNGASLGFLGEDGVNVLRLNLALDAIRR